MRASASAAVRAEPNVTPMIDVILVLLIILMVVTPTLLTGFSAELPAADHSKAHPEAPADHVLGIDAQGRYYLDKRPVSTALLPERLRRLFARTDDRVLFLRADRNLEYARVQEALATAAASGVRVVGMIAERPRDARSPAR
ncbi:MAG TPA: biopolymer transporter ExbD [Gemmatimonadaceae bacterium]|nr:biopolymer transporter ExbD [Gemmatimonadaceae bacterium]